MSIIYKQKNVIINGFDENKEIAKARKLIDKDDAAASKIYQKIYENCPDNYEAGCLSVWLNDDYGEDFNENVRDLSKKMGALDKFIRQAMENGDVEQKKILKNIISPEEACYRSVEEMLFLYPKDKMIKTLSSRINSKVESYKKTRDSIIRKDIQDLEEKMILLEPSYKKIQLPDSKKGCYVATCVYGTYDCPEVWVLRRFRDCKLNKTWFGRSFIKMYYAISPTLVKWFGGTKWFKAMWRGKLDSMVEKYKAEGFEDTPYNDLY